MQDRGVAAHIILTALHHPERVLPERRWLLPQTRRYHTEADIVGVALTFNGLEWEERFNPQTFYVSAQSLRENSRKWHQELKRDP